MNRVTREDGRFTNAAADRIEIVDPDPRWPEAFEREAAVLRDALAGIAALELHHIGSTAVPGLAAKPILDILAMVPDRAQWSEVAPRVEPHGYVHWAENPDPDHLFFAKGMPPFGSGRSHHLHVRPNTELDRHLRFRDALRQNDDLAAEYARHKLDLAQRFVEDREAYTEAKGAFIARVLAAQ